MNELPGFSQTSNLEAAPLSFDFFFDRLELCLRKGRGFSLFQADDACLAAFAEACEQRGLSPLTIHVSAVQNGTGELPATAGFVILIQDLPYEEFVERGAVLADRIVFPLWFRRIPICFFSGPGREAYRPQPIRGNDLHTDFTRAVRALLAEQVVTLLERSNYQVDTPAQLEPDAPIPLFTPIEDKLRTALEAHNLAYQPQMRLGRQAVDFLVKVQSKQVIAECESKAWHAPLSDEEKSMTLMGVPLCRFSGSEIEADVEKCIRTLQEAAHYRALPAYKIDDDLDPSQQAAVQSISGPVRVLAPAGSGKTKTLVNRILNLLNQGVASERILALAFNKKARDEMQDRLERRGVSGVEVRTFHSFGYEIVRDGSGWTFGGASQKKTARALMKSAIQEHTQLPALRNQDPLDAFLAALRKAKMELPQLSTVTVEYGDKVYPLEPIFHSYVEKQVSEKFVDFDDMIYMAVRLLLEDPALRRTYQSRFEFVLVDEFQDLNEAQLLMLQLIGLPENNIFAVGDDDQMIYGFRGADVKHIVEFEKRFPVAATHVLNTNYRSSRMIVRHAGWLIGHNRDRVAKQIQPRKDAQAGRFVVSGHASLLEQAKFAAEWLAEHKKQNNLNWRDYAVLYRYNVSQFPVAVMLQALGIPHTPVETGQLFQTAVGLDLYSYLQVILYPDEAKPADFERILKRPNRYLTNQLVAQAKDWITFLRLPLLSPLRDWERKTLMELIARFENFSHTARLPNISAADYLQMLKTEFGLGEFYREQARLTDDLDQATDEGLLEVMTALAGSYRTPLEFYKFLSKAIVDRESDSDKNAKDGAPDREGPDANEVYLSTIHRAKGKEFRNVVYFNLSQAASDPKQAFFIEEERRVTYVGVTRPKDDLLITFASTKPAEFLREIALNPQYKEVEDEDLQRTIASSGLRLERAGVVLKQIENRKKNQIAAFRELSKTPPAKRAAWLQSLLNKIQLWRVDRALARIEDTDRQIKAHKEGTIAPLERELQAMQEEERMRQALLPSPAPDGEGSQPLPAGEGRGEGARGIQ
jgi:DNA helicase II / ATP-dependent DNA helicase PcrA